MARGIKKVMCITSDFCIWPSLKSVLKRYAVSMVIFSCFWMSLRSQYNAEKMHESVQRSSFFVSSQILMYLPQNL